MIWLTLVVELEQLEKRLVAKERTKHHLTLLRL